MLQLQNVGISYQPASGQAKVVCADLSLTLVPGKLYMLAGRNGSGKSSLLRCIAGLQEPLVGSIFFRDRNIYQAEPQEVSEWISILFSTPPEMPDSSVIEVVLTSMQRNFRWFQSDFTGETEKIRKLLAVCGVGEMADRRFSSLSDGEKQKVMLARSLAQESPMMLLDEPLAFLDYPSRLEMLQQLKKLCEEYQKTILFSSHDLDISLGVCDALILLKSNGNWQYSDDKNWIGSIEPESLFLEN
ncbi:MAG: ABC transporter ATP-binding protein [Bacteroidetes bacterium]|nr:ABC transporter ATP-binding protein [Bacteroidota bacterium]